MKSLCLRNPKLTAPKKTLETDVCTGNAELSLVINGHPISILLPPNDRMHPPQLFSSTYCLRFDASRLRHGAEHDRRGRRDSDRRIPADRGQSASARGGRL